MTREKKLQGIKKDLIKIRAACSALLDYGTNLRHIINLSSEVYCSAGEMGDAMEILQALCDAASRPETAAELADKCVSPEAAKTPYNKYRYYSTERPLQLGAFPQTEDNKPVLVAPFGEKMNAPNIGGYAFGFIEYDQPLTPDQIYQYELTACGE